ncbi:uncharacterized protein PgNI_00618 [Pyricularia grisea]|uniref:Uncharacterized protein n=1 Tax=Pyricularia grisea TaxID=148305 RepID=A0A6P8BLA8_PYRGI|nr:uncharacterized protein PgNI_00618 [Pyricularia grisea]TLD17583.1 hypothetical protein PgNI_00618 [Pyricularia grisea]
MTQANRDQYQLSYQSHHTFFFTGIASPEAKDPAAPLAWTGMSWVPFVLPPLAHGDAVTTATRVTGTRMVRVTLSSMVMVVVLMAGS